jgi:hypothetical protein
MSACPPAHLPAVDRHVAYIIAPIFGWVRPGGRGGYVRIIRGAEEPIGMYGPTGGRVARLRTEWAGVYRYIMAGRPTRAWRRRHPHARLVEAYRDAYDKLSAAFVARPFPPARTDSHEVRTFLEKLTQANLALRLLRAICNKDVKGVVDRAIVKVDKAVREPIATGVYEDPSDWLIESIDCVEEAARRDVQLNLYEPHQ